MRTTWGSRPCTIEQGSIRSTWSSAVLTMTSRKRWRQPGARPPRSHEMHEGGANLLHVRAGEVTRRGIYFGRKRPLAGLELAPEVAPGARSPLRTRGDPQREPDTAASSEERVR